MEKPCKEQPYHQRVKKVIKGSRVKGDAAGGHNNKQYAVRSEEEYSKLLASCYHRGQRCPTRPGCNSRAEAALAREGRRIGKGTNAYVPPKDDKGTQLIGADEHEVFQCDIGKKGRNQIQTCLVHPLQII